MRIVKIYIIILMVSAFFGLSATDLLSDNSSAEFYYSMGQKYIEQGNFDLAVLSLKKAVELSPDWAEVHNLLGTAYYQLFKFNEAISEFDKAVQLKPYYTEAKINRNRAIRSLERYEPVERGMSSWKKIAIVLGVVITATTITIILLKRD